MSAAYLSVPPGYLDPRRESLPRRRRRVRISAPGWTEW